MAETVTDILETRLTLEGERQYRQGLDGATRSLSGLARAGEAIESSGLSRAFGEMVATAAVAATTISFLGRAALAAGEDVATFERAAGNFKGKFPAEDVAEFTAGLQNLTGIADDSIASFISLLGTFQLTAEQAKSLALPILNAAEALKAQGISTEQLAFQIGKAVATGNASTLKMRSGLTTIDDVGFASLDAAGRVKALADALQEQGGDAAVRFRQTLPGAVQALNTSLGSLQESLGEGLVGPLTTATNLADGLAKALAGAPGPVKSLATGIAVALAGAVTLYTVRAGIAVVTTAKLAAEYLKLATAANAAAGATAKVAATPGAAGTGVGGKVGLKRAAAAVGLFGLGVGLDSLGGGGLGQTLGNVGGKAAEVASLGSFFGPKGAAIGGLVGALLGLIESLQRKPEQGDVLEETKKQTALLQEQNEILKQGTPLSPGSGFSVADQYLAQQLVRMTVG